MGTHSHTQPHSNMSISSNFKATKVVIRYTKLQNYGSYSLLVELINSGTASKTLYIYSFSQRRALAPYIVADHIKYES